MCKIARNVEIYVHTSENKWNDQKDDRPHGLRVIYTAKGPISDNLADTHQCDRCAPIGINSELV